jgi:hypothetical protein
MEVHHATPYLPTCAPHRPIGADRLRGVYPATDCDDGACGCDRYEPAIRYAGSSTYGGYHRNTVSSADSDGDAYLHCDAHADASSHSIVGDARTGRKSKDALHADARPVHHSYHDTE